ncbi:MAG: hypothetical protein ACTS4T_00820 [Candidatus Hodgkinia cicadicola]
MNVAKTAESSYASLSSTTDWTFRLNENINGELCSAVESGSCVNRTKLITVDEVPSVANV